MLRRSRRRWSWRRSWQCSTLTCSSTAAGVISKADGGPIGWGYQNAAVLAQETSTLRIHHTTRFFTCHHHFFSKKCCLTCFSSEVVRIFASLLHLHFLAHFRMCIWTLILTLRFAFTFTFTLIIHHYMCVDTRATVIVVLTLTLTLTFKLTQGTIAQTTPRFGVWNSCENPQQATRVLFLLETRSLNEPSGKDDPSATVPCFYIGSDVGDTGAQS